VTTYYVGHDAIAGAILAEWQTRSFPSTARRSKDGGMSAPKAGAGQLVVIEEHIPVAYESWAHWRDECRARRRGSGEFFELDAVVVTEFCAHCWGNGRTLSPAPNGEGPIPKACLHCDGRGSVISVRPQA
jgi:hypothetical protein